MELIDPSSFTLDSTSENPEEPSTLGLEEIDPSRFKSPPVPESGTPQSPFFSTPTAGTLGQLGAGAVSGLTGIPTGLVQLFSPSTGEAMQNWVESKLPESDQGWARSFAGPAIGSTTLSLLAPWTRAQWGAQAAAKVVPMIAGLFGLSAAGQARGQIEKQEEAGVKINPATKVSYIVGYGLAEMLTEGLGDIKILRNLHEIGPEAISKIGEQLLKGELKPVAKTLLKMSSIPAIEGAEEFITQAAQSYMDKTMAGMDLSYQDILKQSTMAGLGGAIGGGIMAGVTLPMEHAAYRRGTEEINTRLENLPKNGSLKINSPYEWASVLERAKEEGEQPGEKTYNWLKDQGIRSVVFSPETSSTGKIERWIVPPAYTEEKLANLNTQLEQSGHFKDVLQARNTIENEMLTGMKEKLPIGTDIFYTAPIEELQWGAKKPKSGWEEWSKEGTFPKVEEQKGKIVDYDTSGLVPKLIVEQTNGSQTFVPLRNITFIGARREAVPVPTNPYQQLVPTALPKPNVSEGAERIGIPKEMRLRAAEERVTARKFPGAQPPESFTPAEEELKAYQNYQNELWLKKHESKAAVQQQEISRQRQEQAFAEREILRKREANAAEAFAGQRTLPLTGYQGPFSTTPTIPTQTAAQTAQPTTPTPVVSKSVISKDYSPALGTPADLTNIGYHITNPEKMKVGAVISKVLEPGKIDPQGNLISPARVEVGESVVPLEQMSGKQVMGMAQEPIPITPIKTLRDLGEGYAIANAESDYAEYQRQGGKASFDTFTQAKALGMLTAPLVQNGIVKDTIRIEGLNSSMFPTMQGYAPGTPLNAAIDESGTLYLNSKVDIRAIGHEMAERIYMILGDDTPLIHEGLRLFGWDKEKLFTAIGDVYAQRTLPTTLRGRLLGWIQDSWASIKNLFGAKLSQNEIVRLMNKQMSGITLEQRNLARQSQGMALPFGILYRGYNRENNPTTVPEDRAVIWTTFQPYNARKYAGKHEEKGIVGEFKGIADHIFDATNPHDIDKISGVIHQLYKEHPGWFQALASEMGIEFNNPVELIKQYINDPNRITVSGTPMAVTGLLETSRVVEAMKKAGYDALMVNEKEGINIGFFSSQQLQRVEGMAQGNPATHYTVIPSASKILQRLFEEKAKALQKENPSKGISHESSFEKAKELLLSKGTSPEQMEAQANSLAKKYYETGSLSTIENTALTQYINLREKEKVSLAMEAMGESYDYKRLRQILEDIHDSEYQKAVSDSTAEAGRELNMFGWMKKRDQALKQLLETIDAYGNKNPKLKKDFEELLRADPLSYSTWDLAEKVMKKWNIPKLKDMFWEVWYSGLCSNPGLWLAINPLTNMLHLGVQVFHSDLRGLVDGFLNFTHLKSNRDYRVGDSLRMIKGIFDGIPRALRATWETLRTGEVPDAHYTKWDMELGQTVKSVFQQSKYKWVRVLGDLLTFNSRFMKAGDVLFNSLAFDAESRRLASLWASQTKAEGLSQRQLLYQYMNDRPKEMVALARRFGRMATFNLDTGRVASAIITARNNIPLGIGKFLFPFMRTINNIMKEGASYLPAVGMLQGKSRGASDILARQIEGSFLTYLIMMLMNQGKITGDVPDDPTQRAQFYGEGKLPQSVRMGDVWYQYKNLDPFATTINAVANFYHETLAAPDGQAADETFRKAVYRSTYGILSNSWMSNVFKLIESEKGFDKWYSRLFSSLVPLSGLWKALHRWGHDTIPQDTTVWQDIVESSPVGLTSAMANELPDYLKPPLGRLNVWGEAITYPKDVFAQWLPSWAASSLPYKISPTVDDPVEQFFASVSGPGQAFYPGLPQKYITRNGKRIDLTPEQHRDYIFSTGKAMKESANRVLQSSDWNSLTPLQQLHRMDKALSRVREFQRRKMIRKLQTYE